MDIIILRYGELALKGKNRNLFENKLVQNVKACLKDNSVDGEVWKIRGRIFIRTTDSSAAEHVKRVFGLTSISKAVEVPLDMGSIKEAALEMVKDGTFRVTARRANKGFTPNSMEIDREVGAFIVENKGLDVKLKEPDSTIGIEIHDQAYVFNETIECFGGLPIGMTGDVIAHIINEDDLLAAWLMMKRGCTVHRALKTELVAGMDSRILNRFCYGVTVQTKRVDTDGLDNFGDEVKALAIVSGQRFPSITSLASELQVIRPLVAFDDSMVDELKSTIGWGEQ